MSHELESVVDPVRLEQWMDDRRLGSGPVHSLEPLAGGTQNILVRFARGDRAYVLRRPPLHKRPNSDETMRREARVLSVLANSGVPHPALIASEPDPAPLGASFYVMEPVDGFNPTLGLPLLYRQSPSLQRDLGLAMPAALASLAAVDPTISGIAELGRADGWIDRQVGRWRTQLDSYGGSETAGRRGLTGVTELEDWLVNHQPQTMHAALIHGDFHFANVLVSNIDGSIAAVVDWELATIGHPLLDLGHLLAVWPRDLPHVTPVHAPHLPTSGEVVDAYADATSLDLSDLQWFRVLACYRLAVILEGSHVRSLVGHTEPTIGATLHQNACSLVDSGLRLF